MAMIYRVTYKVVGAGEETETTRDFDSDIMAESEVTFVKNQKLTDGSTITATGYKKMKA